MVKFYIETLEEARYDAENLLKLHWEQIALNKDKIKLNPDWETYKALEDSGILKIFTAREGATLVGYFVVTVMRNLHYKDHLFASNDLIFLHPDHRKGLVGAKLIQFAEEHLKRMGVSVMTVNTKMHKPFDKLLKWLGFTHIENLYSKYLRG